MKTNFFKIFIPSVTIAFAISGSFMTHATQKSTHSALAGYFMPEGFDDSGNAPQPCSITVTCDVYDSPLCMVMYQGRVYQAYGKINPGDVACPKVLGRRTE